MQMTTEGTITPLENGMMLFAPTGTNYQLHMQNDEQPPNAGIVSGIIAAVGRKIWTISAGGLFIAPINGTPRVVQGRIIARTGGKITVSAGAVFDIQIPEAPGGLDLKNGDLVPGALVNITLMPGARFIPSAASLAKS